MYLIFLWNKRSLYCIVLYCTDATTSSPNLEMAAGSEGFKILQAHNKPGDLWLLIEGKVILYG